MLPVRTQFTNLLLGNAIKLFGKTNFQYVLFSDFETIRWWCQVGSIWIMHVWRICSHSLVQHNKAPHIYLDLSHRPTVRPPVIVLLQRVHVRGLLCIYIHVPHRPCCSSSRLFEQLFSYASDATTSCYPMRMSSRTERFFF
jgi:hypothetical protein